ncbi:HAD family hydrolase [Pelosinus sp. IPA-1]|uniref:HAD family hydrolase n=1 Tax=Pelosinus sp. IPA-1 TaxID=3029569 RepID=UPI0024361BB2|nr:HAD family hydrolase [Pelosinus sp. IPA-1]GMB01258.1 hypothetical protein PIPA1_40570 [Pelosinus sp. IPA-1]
MKQAIEFFEQNKSNIKIVFFDIFDTIFLRDVHPEYVKKLWAKKIHMALGIKASPEQLYAIRNRVEVEICEENRKRGLDLEFNFEDFCKQFFTEITRDEKYGMKGTPYELFMQICEEAELDVEKCVQKIDEDFLVFASFLKERKIPIYCLSDFYLPRRMLMELFQRHGIAHFFTDIFVSSEYLLTKRTGRLYDKVISEMNVPFESVLMVGDNEHSDYKIPRSKKGHAYLIERDVTRAFYHKHMKESLSTKAIERKIEVITQKFLDETKLPFGQIALSLYAFIECLYRNFNQGKVKNVFFLSREGEYLRELFDLYQTIHNVQPINAHYLLVSRKATFLPSLQKLSDEKFDTLFRQYRNISINEFLLNLNFSENQIQEVSIELDFNCSLKLNDLPTDNVFAKLLGNKTFAMIYEHNRNEQYNNFIQYINSFGVNLEEEGLHLIDVGWKGTIQDHISVIMEDISVYGHYLGLVEHGASHDNSHKQGLLFSRIPTKSIFFDAYNENRALFEVILGASHGSAARYVQENNESIQVVVEQEPLERELYENVVRPMQIQLTKLFVAIAEVMNRTHYNYADLERFFAKNHAKMVLFPNEQQLCFFESLYHFENFGLYEFSNFNRTQKIKFMEQLTNFMIFLRNPRKVLSKGFWGPLTLRNEGLGVFSKLYGVYRYLKTFKEV